MRKIVATIMKSEVEGSKKILATQNKSPGIVGACKIRFQRCLKFFCHCVSGSFTATISQTMLLIAAANAGARLHEKQG